MAKQKNAGSGHHEVGYGKPPKQYCFRPGESGNPGGRSRGSVNMKTLLRKVAEKEIPISDNGVERLVSIAEAIVLRIAQGAMQGDPRFARDFIDMCERHLVSDDADAVRELPEEDEEILRRLHKRGNNV